MSFYSRYRYKEDEQLFAPVSCSSSGDNTIVSLIAGRRLRVVSYLLVTAGDVVVTWKSSVAGAISGPMSLGNTSSGQGGGASHPTGPSAALQTAVGEALVLNLSDAISVGGHLTYILI